MGFARFVLSLYCKHRYNNVHLVTLGVSCLFMHQKYMLFSYCSVLCVYIELVKTCCTTSKVQRRSGGREGEEGWREGEELERGRRIEGESREDERRGEKRMKGVERHRRNGFSRPGRGYDCLLSGDRHGARETDTQTDRETEGSTVQDM